MVDLSDSIHVVVLTLAAAAGGVVLAGAAAFAFPFFPPAPGESLEIFVWR